jgi:hypothetical protein
MAKGRSSMGDLAARSIGPFERAALVARFIGVAALTLGAVGLYTGRQAAAPSAAHEGSSSLVYVIFALMFVIPGALYLLLATWVARRRRWAVMLCTALAMLDMMLLGLLFVTSWGAPGAAAMCVLSALFVVALGVMMTYLQRSLEALRRLASP